MVSITRVLDEADIIEAFVRHTACYASHHVFLDNGSRDDTLGILKGLKEEGFGITVFQNKSVNYNEISFNTLMFNHAVEQHAADWVLCLDADEFINDQATPDGLLGTLSMLSRDEPDTRCLRVELLEYRCTSEDDADELIVPSRILSRREPFGVTKVFVSGTLAAPGVSVSGGNHFVLRHGHHVESRALATVKLAHYPERSSVQIIAKWIKGWAKVLAAGPNIVALGTSDHYREPFAILRDTPELLLRNPGFMRLQQNHPLVLDPLAYRGTPLRYTSKIDAAMHASRMMISYMEDLASQHGRLLHECPEARTLVEAWNDEVKLILN